MFEQQAEENGKLIEEEWQEQGSSSSKLFIFQNSSCNIHTICIHDDGDVYPIQLFWGRCLKAMGAVGLCITYDARLYNNNRVEIRW